MSKQTFLPSGVVVILLVELNERFCYFTLLGSQKSLLSQRFGYTNAQSTSIANTWTAACYLFCVAGGVLGDIYFGRFLTIFGSCCLYVCGTFVVAVSTLPHINSSVLFFSGAFLGVALGTGGVKPNLCNFGADQISDEDVSMKKEDFFYYFYWVINIGAVVAVGIMSTVATSPETLHIPAKLGYFTAYFVGALSITLAFVVFLAGSVTYVNKDLRSRVMVIRPVCSAICHSAGQNARGAFCLFGWMLIIPFFVLSFVQAFLEESHGTTWVAGVVLVIGIAQLASLAYAHCNNSFLEQNPTAQSHQEGGDVANAMTIDQIHQTFQTMPLFILGNIPFGFALTMIIGPFQTQACQMDLRVGHGQISGMVFILGDILAIILFIPFLQVLAYPTIERLRSRPVSVNEKLIIAFAMAALAMISATALEFARRHARVLGPPGWSASSSLGARFPNTNITESSGNDSLDYLQDLMGSCRIDGKEYCSNCAPMRTFTCEGVGCEHAVQRAGIYMSDISGFWMCVPFAFIGLGEAILSPALFFVAYGMTPTIAQSIIQALNLVFWGAYPPALVSALSTVLAQEQPLDLNRGRIEVFYYVSLSVIIVGAVLLFVVMRVVRLQAPGNDSESTRLLSAGTASEMMDTMYTN